MLVSRDRLTRRMQGDAFGSVSQRSRFATGDPGLGSFLGRAIKGGIGFLKGAIKAQVGLPNPAPPPSTTTVVRRIAAQRTDTVNVGGQQIRLPPLGSAGGVVQMEFPTPQSHSGRRRRRMNPLNPRALRRSMSRVQSFARFASRTISFTKRVRMKRARRRRAA